jgi:hypothetical protein
LPKICGLGIFTLKEPVEFYGLKIALKEARNFFCSRYQQSLEFSGDFNFVINAFCILFI